jgi:tetratricopeptide (TPR) repeat protein
LQQGLALEPDNPTYVPAYSLLGSALPQAGRVEQSITQLQNGVERDPDDVDVRFNLAKSLLQLRRADEALANFEEVLKHDPDNTEAQKNMAWVLATWPEARVRDGPRAVELAERANQLTDRRNPLITLTLAAAYAEAGRFSDAIKTAEHALQIANESGSVELAQTAREQLALYRSGKPLRENRQ